MFMCSVCVSVCAHAHVCVSIYCWHPHWRIGTQAVSISFLISLSLCCFPLPYVSLSLIVPLTHNCVKCIPWIYWKFLLYIEPVQIRHDPMLFSSLGQRMMTYTKRIRSHVLNGGREDRYNRSPLVRVFGNSRKKQPTVLTNWFAQARVSVKLMFMRLPSLGKTQNLGQLITFLCLSFLLVVLITFYRLGGLEPIFRRHLE